MNGKAMTSFGSRQLWLSTDSLTSCSFKHTLAPEWLGAAIGFTDDSAPQVVFQSRLNHRKIMIDALRQTKVRIASGLYMMANLRHQLASTTTVFSNYTQISAARTG